MPNLLILVCGGLLLLGSAAGCSSPAPTVTPIPTPTLRLVSTNIVNGNIGVTSGKYQYYQFSIPRNSSSARVSGNFTASGGAGNDIRVLLLSNDDFINW